MTKPRALVTGASSGIGAAYARRLAKEGYDLVLVARRQDRLDALAAELDAAHGTQAEVTVADLGDMGDVKRVEDRLISGPQIDMLVNNAGFGVFALVQDLEPSVIDEMVTVNALALMRLTRAALQPMLKRGDGTIINLCSGSVFFPMADASVYMATKALIFGFTRGVHEDVGKKGIKVQALVPGITATEFFIRATGQEDRSADRPGMVLSADDLVEASLAGLKMGEMVCIPSLPDYETFERFHAAELAVLGGVSKDRYADRYRS